MNNTKYNLRHVACNMEDFNSDRHRFRFEYNGKEYVIPCYGASDIFFDEVEKEIPEDVLCEIQDIIWDKIDREEKKWRYPKEAYEIADAYCKENFS
jgi:hypothetical protein